MTTPTAPFTTYAQVWSALDAGATILWRSSSYQVFIEPATTLAHARHPSHRSGHVLAVRCVSNHFGSLISLSDLHELTLAPATTPTPTPTTTAPVDSSELWSRALSLLAQLESVKPLYRELDLLLLDLAATPSATYTDPSGTTYCLRDNFASTNTVFRPAGVKRWEIVEDPTTATRPPKSTTRTKKSA